jgi:hypothetical protein
MAEEMNLVQKFWHFAQFGTWPKANVRPVPVGLPNDGLTQQIYGGGTSLDKNWGVLEGELRDARAAWRKNPIARRIPSLITAFVVGPGITVRSDDEAIQEWVNSFWLTNKMDTRIAEWCDELSRSGELFPVVFFGEDDDVYVRAIPSSRIMDIKWASEGGVEDYEQELGYREVADTGYDEKWWKSPITAVGKEPVMMHYAVNRVVGAIRGESDLVPGLPWLRYYDAMLKDRVRLNASTRAFIWQITAAKAKIPALENRWANRGEPVPGSVIIAEKDAEEWKVMAPNLNSADASHDMKAVRRMIVASFPGFSLLDLGEGDDNNLATGKVMTEMRRRFLLRRQSYFRDILKRVIIEGYNRSNNGNIDESMFDVVMPDISPEDNVNLSQAGDSFMKSAIQLRDVVGDSDELRAMLLRLYVKFLGEPWDDAEIDLILQNGAEWLKQKEQREEMANDRTDESTAVRNSESS